MQVYEAGMQFKSKNGLTGTVEVVNGIKRLIVRNTYGRITQSINLKDIELNKFERISNE